MLSKIILLAVVTPPPGTLPGFDPFEGPAGRSGGSGSGVGGIELVNPLGTYNFLFIVDRIIYWLLILAIPIVTIMVLYAAFLLITSGGNPEKVKQALKTILYAAIGYAVLLISRGISFLISQLLIGF